MSGSVDCASSDPPQVVSRGPCGSDDRHAQLTSLSAVAAVAAIRNGEVKAEDYAEALLERAARCADLNAFCILRADEVREAARAADRHRLAGRALGRMHGLPIAVKDSINTRSLPTSNGTRALRSFCPRDNAGVLEPLLAQGALILGKTNLHELSCGWTSNNAEYGAVRNPYDSTRTPGGSSGGSAVAVAAGIAPLAIGEDTYGSIRVPASFCGLAGLRPTHGRYPNDGIMPLSRDKFDQVGPLARAVEDIVLFDSVVTRRESPLTALSPSGIRIGISPRHLGAGIDPECDRLLSEALDRLRAAGAIVVTAELPPILHEASAVTRTILNHELLGSVSEYLTDQQSGLTLDELMAQTSSNLAPVLLASRNPGPRAAYETALRQREQIQGAAAAYFREFALDALAFPPTMMPAFAQGDAAAVEINGRTIDLFTAIGRNVALSSCAALPSLVLPIGMTSAGLPFGLEFDAPQGSDGRLLALGLSLESALGPIAPPRPSARESIPRRSL